MMNRLETKMITYLRGNLLHSGATGPSWSRARGIAIGGDRNLRSQGLSCASRSNIHLIASPCKIV
jgi:hypothetical protein